MIKTCILAFICLLGACQTAPLPYVYLHSQAVEQPLNQEPYVVMTLNACMMDRNLPTLYGGMTPWEERIDRLASYILEEDADVYLGQELMFDSGKALAERLEGTYANIWYGIGDVEDRKQSGLFVASKRLPAEGPIFVPFSEEDQVELRHFPNQTRLIHRGFFCLDMGKFYLVTTHLEGGSEVYKGETCRLKQLELITKYMDRKGKPYVVTGDINIARTGMAGDEYSRSTIERDYYDAYTLAHPAFDESTYTCTNLFTAIANGRPIPEKEEDRNEIDDYFLIRKPFQDQFVDLNVELLGGTYDVNQPREEAITDHKAYKATFFFKE